MNDLQALTALEAKLKEQKKLQENIEQNTTKQIQSLLQNLADDLKSQNSKNLNGLHQDIQSELEETIKQLHRTTSDKLDKATSEIIEEYKAQIEKPKDWQNLGIYALLGAGIAFAILLFYRLETYDSLEKWQVPSDWRTTDGRKRYLQLNYEQEQGKIWTDKQNKTITIEIGR